MFRILSVERFDTLSNPPVNPNGYLTYRSLPTLGCGDGLSGFQERKAVLCARLAEQGASSGYYEAAARRAVNLIGRLTMKRWSDYVKI